MSSVSTPVPTSPDLITLADIFKIIWVRKVLFVLVALFGIIASSIIAFKQPKKITYSILYKAPVVYNSNNSYLDLVQKKSPRISYSCIDGCKFVELSYKVSQSESKNKTAKMVFDKFIMDAKSLQYKLYGQEGINNKEVLLLKSEIESIKKSLDSLNSILISSQKSKDYQAENATLKNITDYKIMLLEKESRLKEISNIQPGTTIGNIKTTPAKSKTKLILLAGVILSLIAAFSLVLMLDAVSKNKK